ncbi:hypothetical protein [Streptomyces sp. TLI_105]|uniref:hypothetical protein n=1 Tax=Streptomyces sp. TLI_105 TaxID=1881019 RepID=UPI000894C77A|nr:hypothetical protein [Streptomyces sp. TLI_105]SEC21858.1 hypothetical protein SAMN05428939_1842 [Streptomyces sp. TLI_105]
MSGSPFSPVGLMLLSVLVIIIGVVLPAVWSTSPARRRAASSVLAQLLKAARSRR